MIEFRALEKSYEKLNVLRNISFLTQGGRVTALVGPNGCGKTTLIKMLLGLVVPDQGEIAFCGKSVLGQWDYRSEIGYMPQNPDFPSQIKVRELFDLLEDVRNQKAIYRTELENLFQLEPELEKPFGALSGGTKQKVAAVVAFMFNPKALVLDEPTVGLDPVSALRFKELVRRGADSGKAILLVSHIMGEMEQLADDINFICDGRLFFSGSAHELKKLSQEGSLEKAVVQLFESNAAKVDSSKKVTSAEPLNLAKAND